MYICSYYRNYLKITYRYTLINAGHFIDHSCLGIYFIDSRTVFESQDVTGTWNTE